jgi:ubiquinone/menaquinone biosynthesis C-methylase UbiE
MASEKHQLLAGEHDWHSSEYVDQWIARDVTRDEERRPLLRRMFTSLPFSSEKPIRVLDVGGGYGLVTEELLKLHPHAQVTLQDYSEPMLEHARQRLSAHADQIAYVSCDLRDASWTARVGGPFDVAISAIALHNLRDPKLIAACYRGIRELLAPGGAFVNCDHFDRIGGVEKHVQTLQESGFARAECTWQEPRNAILTAYTAA